MTERRPLPKPTDRQPLGTSGLEVSPICIGLLNGPETVAAAYEAGVNFFFITADMHWPLYADTRRGIAQLLEAHPEARDSLVIGVVSYVTQTVFMWAPFEEVLSELPALERIDLTIAGGCYSHDFPARKHVLESHRHFRHVGARAIGASFHDRAAARDAITAGGLDIAYVRFNPVHAGARSDLFPHISTRADGRRCLLYNFKSTHGYLLESDYAKFGIADDFWRPHVTDYYRFALSQPAVDGLLCSPCGEGEVRELIDGLARGALDDEDQQYLLDLGELVRGTARVA